MAVNKRLIGAGATAAAGGLTPSEHFGVVLYEGDGSSSHSINGGKFGAAFYGNGSNSKITFDTNFSQQTSFTISFWFNSSQYNDDHTIFQFEGDSNENSNRIGLFASGTEFGFYPHNTSGGAGRTSISTSDSSALYNGNWHHVALVIDGTSNSDATMYIDGSSKTLTTYESYTTTMRMTGDMRIGGRKDDSAGEFMEGKLDQLRVFQKALTSSEVSTLYAETASTVESLDPLSEDTTDTLQVLGDTSCLALYRFENNEDDLSGNYNGTGTQIQYAAGRYGQAAQFNTGSSVTVSGLSSMFGSKTTFSVSLWFKTTATGNRALFDDYTAQNYNLQLYLYDGNLNASVRFNNSDGNMTASSSTYNDGNWHHVVVTSNQTTYYTYVDGSQIRTWSAPVQTYSGGSPTPTIGASQGGTVNYFDGEIDQVRIFNKQISASEVTTLYNENSLIASYRFEGNSNDDRRTYDGTDSNVTYEFGVDFTPDLVWAKRRSTTEDNVIFDSSRGVQKQIVTNKTNAESTKTNALSSFDLGGFTTGANNALNTDGEDYVAWCFKANGGTTSSNTDGTITSTVQANQDAGFSIVTYTGTGSTGTYGHGLSSSPDWIITKRTDAAEGWLVWSSSLSESNYIYLNGSGAAGTDTNAYKTIGATTNQIGTDVTVNTSGGTYISYCFHNVDNFSKFGSYVGNGSNDGTIVETGFEPAFVMIKDTSEAHSWTIHDNKRDLTNPRKKYLLPSAHNVEAADLNGINFYSNGFQLLDDYQYYNKSGNTYIYWAIAADADTEQPTVAKSFSTVTYTGNSSTQSIEGLGFSPSFIWLKNRDSAVSHTLFDVIRGAGTVNQLYSDDTKAMGADTTLTNLISFDSDGFTLGSTSGYNVPNNSGDDYVAWAWKADDNEPTLFGGNARAVYKFEDNANDVTGNYNGTASNVSYVTGKFNKAADFNGSSSYINTGLTKSNWVSDLNSRSVDFTISLWANVDAAVGGDNTFLYIGNYNVYSPNYAAMIIDYRSSGSKIRFTHSSTYVESTSTISLDTWYHIVCVRESGVIKLYINGVLENSATPSADMQISSSAVATLGALYFSSTTHGELDGMLDQFRFYSGAVSDIGVAALYAETVSDNDDLSLAAPKETIISANANAGFSIVKYEGDGTSGRRIPHGLSSAPELIIAKANITSSWVVYSSTTGTNKFLELNSTAAEQTISNYWGTSSPSATTFGVAPSNSNNNSTGNDVFAYCFHSVSGYSKIGSYTGTSSSGNSVNVGFAPDWVLIKGASAGSAWILHDTVRSDGTAHLRPNTSGVEDTGSNEQIDFTSTGFSIRNSGATQINTSGDTYIYMAFKIN